MDNKKRNFTTALYFFLLTLPIAAQDLPGKMTPLLEQILGWFTGPVVKTILVISLVGSAIGFGIFKDSEKMKRNAIAVGAAAIIILVASEIVGTVWGNAGGK